ncbi:MAG: DUF3422 domain-containing protein, partial [Pseudomonadota bacterium]
MLLPENHEQREELNDEVHARPPEALEAPVAITYIALFEGGRRGEDARAVRELAERFSITPPDESAVHASLDFGGFRLKWERHTEFSRLKVIVPVKDDATFQTPAISQLPEDWISGLPGRTMVATNILLLPAPKGPVDIEALSQTHFGGNTLIGASVGGGKAEAYTDFRIRSDGFSRLIVYDNGLALRQAGRVIQRLVEIDTYRLMALLAFPMARGLAPKLTLQERELALIANAMSAETAQEEPVLLDRLTRLQAAIESGQAETDYRFSAARAYYDLVHRRIKDLREARLEGLQTFGEFTERRLLPAINTCVAIADRQEKLSRRVARATQLLSTRVDVAREGQNQEVASLRAAPCARALPG